MAEPAGKFGAIFRSKEFAMSQRDPVSIDAIIARANYERSMALAEIIADGVLYVSRGIAKVWHGALGLFSHRAGGHPVAGT